MVLLTPYLLHALASGPLTRSGLIETKTLPSSPSSGPLAKWLQQNNAILSSSIGTDQNGLRGLQKNINDQSNVLCRIPRKLAIVADRSVKKNKRPIDALALALLKEIRLKELSAHYHYIQSLPAPEDISLAGIGGTWTDKQLERLGYDPTKAHFASLRAQREHFIESNCILGDDNDERLTCWAYDLASSRALEGPFGRSGAIRAALTGTIVSMLMAFMPVIYLNELTQMPIESAIPVMVSTVSLVSTLVSKEPELAMIPWIDIVNHKSKSSLYLEYDLVHDGIKLKGGKGSSDEKFITFDYGGASQGISNDRLLGEYGFVEENNPNDTLDIKVGVGSIVSVGRWGYVVRSTPTGEECSLKDETVMLAARRVRDILAAASTASADLNDSIDSERARLAVLWRKEKIRLLDRFINL